MQFIAYSVETHKWNVLIENVALYYYIFPLMPCSHLTFVHYSSIFQRSPLIFVCWWCRPSSIWNITVKRRGTFLNPQSDPKIRVSLFENFRHFSSTKFTYLSIDYNWLFTELSELRWKSTKIIHDYFSGERTKFECD